MKDLNVTTLQSPRLVVASLSGGQRQSVAVARSVMWSAKLVMLDEPTAALGVAQTKQVLDLIRRLKQQGHAVIVISHNLADVFEVADRVVVLYLGRKAATSRPRTRAARKWSAAITGLNQQVSSRTGEQLDGDARPRLRRSSRRRSRPTA